MPKLKVKLTREYGGLVSKLDWISQENKNQVIEILQRYDPNDIRTSSLSNNNTKWWIKIDNTGTWLVAKYFVNEPLEFGFATLMSLGIDVEFEVES